MSQFLHRTGLVFARPSSVAFVTSTTSTAATISAPASVNAGDLLVLFDLAISGISPVTNVVPSGFTQIATDATLTTSRTTISYKIADGSEGSATLTGMDSTFEAKVLLQFRANIQIQSVTAQDVSLISTSGSPSSESITASGGAAPLIILAYYGSDKPVALTFTGATPDGTITNSTTLDNVVKHLSYNAGETPVDITIGVGNGDSVNFLGGMYIELS